MHRELRKAGHADSWVGAYAYSSYTEPPLKQRFDNESKVLVLSVGFDSVLDYSNDTARSRAGWGGWVAAGAKGMALRPNSLWSAYGPLNYRTAARTPFLRPYLAHFCPVFLVFSRFSPS